MGLGVAEVDQESITQVFGYVPFESTHGAGADLLVATDHVPKYFGV